MNNATRYVVQDNTRAEHLTSSQLLTPNIQSESNVRLFRSAFVDVCNMSDDLSYDMRYHELVY